LSVEDCNRGRRGDINPALTVVVIQRADTRTPTTTTKKKRKMAVVTGDDDEPDTLLRRPSGTAAVAGAVAMDRLAVIPPLSTPSSPAIRLR
jgi:hypothetical protein